MTSSDASHATFPARATGAESGCPRAVGSQVVGAARLRVAARRCSLLATSAFPSVGSSRAPRPSSPPGCPSGPDRSARAHGGCKTKETFTDLLVDFYTATRCIRKWCCSLKLLSPFGTRSPSIDCILATLLNLSKASPDLAMHYIIYYPLLQETILPMALQAPPTPSHHSFHSAETSCPFCCFRRRRLFFSPRHGHISVGRPMASAGSFHQS